VSLHREDAQAEAEQRQQALESKADQRQALEEMIQELMEQWNVPGVGLGVVHQGETLIAEGFGFADYEEQIPATKDTLFAIGSATKAFTTAAVALMAEEGHLAWDQPAAAYLPWFELYDPYAARRATLRDFALHRSGMARHDFSWYGRELTRREILASMEHLQPGAELREGFIYNNHGYALLGYLAGEAAGMEWEELLETRFFDPLGMDSTGSQIAHLQDAPDHAKPYQQLGEEVSPMDYRDLDAMGPAGSISSNVNDLLRWVQMFLDSGQAAEGPILQPSSVRELTRPQVALPVGEFPEMRFSNYALGWMVDDYRGQVLVHHGGNIDGYSALTAFIPEERLGIVILTNMNNSPLPQLAVYRTADIVTDREPVDWTGRMQQATAAMPEDSVRPPRQIPDTEPSRPLPEFAGLFEHPGYGRIETIWSEEEEQLKLRFLGEEAPLLHWHYDVFAARIPGQAVGLHLPVHFHSDLDGFITQATLPLDASTDPVAFAFTAGPELYEEAYLEQFAGSYELLGMMLTVRVQGDRLALDVPGQPALVFLPEREKRFAAKDYDGYSLEFIRDNDEITGLWLNQPFGSFPADRKQ